MVKEQLNVEQPKIKEKEKKPQHELELERESKLLKGESYDIWIKRIGGPNVTIVETLGKYAKPKKKENGPLIIDSDGAVILNDKNIVKYFGEEWKKQVDDRNLFNEKTKEYQIGKELWGNPDDYRGIIINLLKGNHKIVVDKRFAKSVEEWGKKLKAKEKPKEKKPEKEVKEEKKPEVKERPLTLDEKIEQKEKELEKVEQNYNIYYSPVVRDLLGLYYKSEFKSLKKEVKKLKKAREKVGGEVAVKGVEVESSFAEATEDKKPIAKDYLKHIKYTNKLFIEMVKVRWAVKKGEADPSEYEEIKSEWRTAYKKTGEMYDDLSEEDQEKTIKKREKEMKRSKKGKSLLKKKWKELWKLVIKKFGKETIDEVTRDAMEEEIEVIKERLKKIPQEIKKSGVLEQTKLEDEQKRLEKHLKKFK